MIDEQERRHDARRTRDDLTPNPNLGAKDGPTPPKETEKMREKIESLKAAGFSVVVTIRRLEYYCEHGHWPPPVASDCVQWKDLIVGADTWYTMRLGDVLKSDDPDFYPELRRIQVNDEGGIGSWEGFYVWADGEDPDASTPRRPVDWSGFAEALNTLLVPQNPVLRGASLMVDGTLKYT